MIKISSCVQEKTEEKDATRTLQKLLSQDGQEPSWQELPVKMSLEEMARRLQRVQSWGGEFEKVDFSEAMKAKLATDDTLQRINQKHWDLAGTIVVS